MTREQAIQLAAQCNANGDGVSFKAMKMRWRDGDHWYVKGNNDDGVFLTSLGSLPTTTETGK